QFAQIEAFALPHLGSSGLGLVVVPAQMQQPMNDVKRQFRLDRMPSVLRLTARHLRADHQLARQAPCIGFAQGKTQYVGRLVVIEVAVVELMNGWIIYEGETDFRLAYVLAFEDRAHDLPHGPAVHGDSFLGTGDRDANHGCLKGAYRFVLAGALRWRVA